MARTKNVLMMVVEKSQRRPKRETQVLGIENKLQKFCRRKYVVAEKIH